VIAMDDKADAVEARLGELELRVIKLGIAETIYMSMAGMVLGSLAAEDRKEIVSHLRDLASVGTRDNPGSAGVTMLVVQEEASKMLDHIETIADAYRATL
jgi:hypothetical protein